MEKVAFDWTACINGIKAGNQKAFEFFYTKTYDKLKKRILVKMGFNEQDAEDILQEVYVTVYQKIGDLREPNAAISWLNTLCDRICIDALRKDARRSGIADVKLESELSSSDEDTDDFSFDMLESNEISIEGQIEQKEVQRILADIISDLAPMQCQCIELQMAEKSIKEIAGIIGLPEGTVKTHIFNAKKKIKEKVETLEKQGTKLYSLAPLPFFYLIYRLFFKSVGTAPKNAALKTAEIISRAQIHSAAQSAGTIAKNAGQAAQNAGTMTEGTIKTVSRSVIETKTTAAAADAAATAGAGTKAVAGAAAAGLGVGKIAAIIAAAVVAVAGIGIGTAAVVKNHTAEPATETVVAIETESLTNAEKETEGIAQQETEIETDTDNQSETTNDSEWVEAYLDLIINDQEEILAFDCEKCMSLKDVNGDGIPELFYLLDDGEKGISKIWTVADGVPVLLTDEERQWYSNKIVEDAVATAVSIHAGANANRVIYFTVEGHSTLFAARLCAGYDSFYDIFEYDIAADGKVQLIWYLGKKLSGSDDPIWTLNGTEIDENEYLKQVQATLGEASSFLLFPEEWSEEKISYGISSIYMDLTLFLPEVDLTVPNNTESYDEIYKRLLRLSGWRNAENESETVKENMTSASLEALPDSIRERYIQELEEYKNSILDAHYLSATARYYGWSESYLFTEHPIAFADVTGDGIVDMLYLAVADGNTMENSVDITGNDFAQQSPNESMPATVHLWMVDSESGTTSEVGSIGQIVSGAMSTASAGMIFQIEGSDSLYYIGSTAGDSRMLTLSEFDMTGKDIDLEDLLQLRSYTYATSLTCYDHSAEISAEEFNRRFREVTDHISEILIMMPSEEFAQEFVLFGDYSGLNEYVDLDTPDYTGLSFDEAISLLKK